MFWTEANRLIFSGTTGEDILPVIAALHNLINKQGYSDIILDFARLDKINNSYMLPLVATARLYRKQKIEFTIALPVDIKCSNLVVNTNWAHLIAPESFDPMDEKNVQHLSAIQYLNGDEQFIAVNRCMDVILKSLKGLDRGRVKALEWSLNEITDNVLNHAESPIGGIVQVVTNAKLGWVDFYECDASVGIPKTLRQGRPELKDDASALRQAIEEGVTRNRSTNQGNGLYGTFKCCEVSGGSFNVLTGRVSLHFVPGSLNVTTNQIPLNGTFIHASIRYDIENLLERALIFKGRQHDPGNDYIERVYLISGESISFSVLNELDSFGTRVAGRLARTKIENLMDNKKRTIEFDFEGIHLISSSFADEVFGFIFAELGPIRFGNLCQFKNVDPTVQALIDRSIYQRMKQA